ncbi:MAG TPA: hypothetical protein VGI85_11740 [Chthoniobacterales bacterium]
MKKVYIVLLSVLAACIYGIIHDQITARVCLEYFTITHPPLFPTASTTVLALCWGVAATAGIGFMLGVVLAIVSQSGESSPWPISSVMRSILLLLAVMGASAFIAGLVGYGLSAYGVISFPKSLAAAIPEERHDRFMAVWFAHGASYLTGLLGAGILCFWIWTARGRPSVLSVFPRTRAGWLRTALLAGIVGCILWFRFSGQ